MKKSSTRVRSFPPIENEEAEVLILGSMPGWASLAASQYYAHPQNAFWRILSDILELQSHSSYETRARALKGARIALWDVLKSCVRRGSLDSEIDSDSEISNDFPTFFRRHGRITRVFFNGTKAETSFKRHVLPRINPGAIKFSRLPSTSPANASIPYTRKLKAWKSALLPRRA